jgi:hypothetical protein
LFRVPALPFTFSPPELVSCVVPALLFKDVSLRKPGSEIPRPPVAAHPHFVP